MYIIIVHSKLREPINKCNIRLHNKITLKRIYNIVYSKLRENINKHVFYDEITINCTYIIVNSKLRENGNRHKNFQFKPRNFNFTFFSFIGQ